MLHISHENHPFQYSLKTLFIVITIGALIFGYSRFRPEFGFQLAMIYIPAAIFIFLRVAIGKYWESRRHAIRKRQDNPTIDPTK